MLFLGKYFSKSSEILKAETTRHYAKQLSKKLVVIVMISVPGPEIVKCGFWCKLPLLPLYGVPTQ